MYEHVSKELPSLSDVVLVGEVHTHTHTHTHRERERERERK